MADSAFKDGGSVTVPNVTKASIDSIVTTLPSANNIVIAMIQFNNGAAALRTIGIGNLELRRGTVSTDFLVAENEELIGLNNNNLEFSERFVCLMGRDATPGASPTYAVHALANAATVTAEVKFLIINGATSASSDGVSIGFAATRTTIGTLTTTFPAATASQPHIILAVIHVHMIVVGERADFLGNVGFRIENGATVLATNQFVNVAREGDTIEDFHVLLIAQDAAGIANDTYTVTGLNDRGAEGDAEVKMVGIAELDAIQGDSGTVAVGTTRTVILSRTTTFADGTNVVIGAYQHDSLDLLNGVDYAAGAIDMRIAADAASEVDNQFNWEQGLEDGGRPGNNYAMFVNQHVDQGASDTYEIGALAPVALDAAGEGKMVVIHIKDAAAGGRIMSSLVGSGGLAGAGGIAGAGGGLAR